MGFSLLFYSMPDFWLGLLLLVLLANTFPIFPTGGFTSAGSDKPGSWAPPADQLQHFGGPPRPSSLAKFQAINIQQTHPLPGVQFNGVAVKPFYPHQLLGGQLPPRHLAPE